jgi:hypothetical protein
MHGVHMVLRHPSTGRHFHLRMLLLGAMALGVGALHSSAQVNDATQRFDRELQQLHLDTAVLANQAVPADQRALFDFGGYVTVSYLSLDDLNKNNHSLNQYDLVGYVDYNIDQVQELFVRGRLEWQEFSPGDAFDGRDHQFHAEIERAYYRVDLARAMSAYRGVTSDNDLAVRAGRQFVYWGQGVALSQTLDGAVIDLSHKDTALEFLAGVTPASTVDIDPSRPHFDNNTHRGFYGAMLSQQIGMQQPFIYFFSQQDYNHDYVSITGAAGDAIHTRFKYNSDYLSIGCKGTIGDHFTYGGEAIYESGNTLSNSFNDALAPEPQTRNEIDAFAGDLRVDYLLNDSRKTRFSGEGIFATGDDGRRETTNTLGGAPPNTRDTSFNAFGQVQNGEAFSPNISNLFILRVGASTFPLQQMAALHRLQAGLDMFLFEKFAVDAPLDEPSNRTGYVGVEPDLFVNWQMASDVTLAVRYGVFFPGSAIVNNNIRQFFYAGVTFAF